MVLWKADSHSTCQTIACFLYGIRNLITALTKVAIGHHILSQLNPIRTIYPCLPKVHLNVILPPTPRSSQRSLTFGPPKQDPVNTSPIHPACHMSRPPHPSWLNHPNNIQWRIQVMKFNLLVSKNGQNMWQMWDRKMEDGANISTFSFQLKNTSTNQWENSIGSSHR
jgi:hypothetical protein